MRQRPLRLVKIRIAAYFHGAEHHRAESAAHAELADPFILILSPDHPSLVLMENR